MVQKQRRRRERRLVSSPVESDRRAEPRRQYQERRSAVRVPIDLWMEEVRGDEVYFRRSCNLSHGGVFFEQSIPHPVGTQVTLRFALPGLAEEMTARGEVVSAANANDGLGMGVTFTEMSEQDRATLDAFIDKTKARRGVIE